MEENIGTNNRKESTGMALSGLILGIIGLICAFMPNWRSIGLVIALVGLAVSIFSIYKTNKTGAKITRAVVGTIISVIAIVVSGFFLYDISNIDQKEEEAMPVELKDTNALEEDHSNALQKLEGLTDSSSIAQ